MSCSDLLVGSHSTKPEESFRYLRALLDYASNDRHNESSIYGAVSFVLTLFCMSATVTATKFNDLYLGCFPQKDLKMSRPGRSFRAPDFTVLVVQSIGQQFPEVKIGDMGPLIWEVKASSERLTWFGEGRPKQPDIFELFFQHFRQITAQVVFAKAKFNQKPVYALLSIDIWFVLLHFPDDAPSLVWTPSKKGKPQFRLADYRTFYNYLVIPPAPIVNENCTAFSPQFVYALSLSVENLTDVTVTPHSSFCVPKGTAELISAQLRNKQLSAKLEEEGRRAEVESKFALGEEDSDERSTRWSASEEHETDRENQKHPAAVPATLDHLLTSPAKTRSKVIALNSRTVAKTSTQPEASIQAGNVATPSARRAPVVHPVPVGKARPPRPRRKAAKNTPGYRNDNPSGDE